MVKRVLALLVVLLFAIGAVGGCLNQTPPDLSGTWEGTLSRSANPTIPNFANVTIEELTQDQNNQFSGTVKVTYNPNTDDQVELNATIDPSESSTNEWGATIKASGIATSKIDVNYPNGSFSIEQEQTYTFTFTLPHLYACRGESINELVGTYVLNAGNSAVDSGTVNLVKQ
ncbi:hypothetical protein H5T89_06740 [bacterium]|nr:hypothetical protein [bacterium]